MAMDSDRAATAAKSKLTAKLQAAGLSPSDATTAAENAIDNMGVCIIEAIIEELRTHAETSGGETLL